MLDISHTLIHKLTLQINRRTGMNTEISTADLVKGILYDRFAEKHHLTSEWRMFANGGKLVSDDESLKGSTASVATDDASLWAAHIIVKDPEYPRRRWVYYIGQRSENEDVCLLYYAKCCYDHMAGSIMEAKPIPATRDSFLDPLFFNKYIQCMCGENVLSNAAEELTHTTLPDLLKLLRDETRKQPVFLITCSWYMSPEKLADIMLGNAVVFWCDNSSVVMRLNSMLPQNMYTSWDSVRIFMPDVGDRTFHPMHSLDEIRQMGIDKFRAGLCQAYCQSMRSEERRNFLTLEEIYSVRRRQQAENLVQQLVHRDEKLSDAAEQIAELKNTNAALQEQLDQAPVAKLPMDASEYEAMLNEAIKETDGIKRGIERMMTQLCSDMGLTYQPDPSESVAILQELAHTIYACLQRVSDRK